jgi:hypothetical protein
MVFTPENAAQNLDQVFFAAERLGIPKLLDGEDICVAPEPKSIYTYLTKYVNFFGRGTRIRSFVGVRRSLCIFSQGEGGAYGVFF